MALPHHASADLYDPTVPTPSEMEAAAASQRWLHVVSHLDPKFGGLSAVVPELAAAVSHAGRLSASLGAFCDPAEHIPTPAENPAFTGLPVSRWPMGRRQWLTDASLRHRFLDVVDQVDGLHLHGLWEQSTLAGARSARSRNRPYIVSAHGMLEPWALRNKSLKKHIYSALAERNNLGRSACLHALTRAEAEDYRRYGTQRPIAVIPNGVHVPRSVDGDQFYVQYSALKGRRIFLFLGRIHFKKGLDVLVQAWKQIAAYSADAHLVLAGPNSEGTQPAIERQIEELGIVDRVTFTGMLKGSMKWNALAAAECFVLPSYSEGLSVSTLEAMALGLPVIVSDHCNLPEVSEFGAGWQIRAEVDPLVRALQECLENSPQQNASIGERGAGLVADRYTWAAVGAQMEDLYGSILGGVLPTKFELQAA